MTNSTRKFPRLTRIASRQRLSSQGDICFALLTICLSVGNFGLLLSL